MVIAELMRNPEAPKWWGTAEANWCWAGLLLEEAETASDPARGDGLRELTDRLLKQWGPCCASAAPCCARIEIEWPRLGKEA